MASVVMALSVMRVGAQAITVTQILELGPERGGPERLPGTLGVSATGGVAYTFGFDAGDALVSVIDSTGTLLFRAGRRGAGPGEFSSVLAMFFRGAQLLAFGPGQISAFDGNGRHEWSRAVGPYQVAVAVNGDSVDLMDARYFADGRGVGNVHRRSLQRGGGERLLLDGGRAEMRTLARAADDSSRFLRLGYASGPSAIIVGNSQTSQLVALSASGAVLRTVSDARPVRRRTPAEVSAELLRLREAAAAPFRMPDGSVRRIPFDESAARTRLAVPVPYFNARLGGLHVEPATGDAIVIEPRGNRTAVVRVGRSGRREGTLPCDVRDGTAAVAWPFVAVTCVKTEDGERVPVLRLYRLR